MLETSAPGASASATSRVNHRTLNVFHHPGSRFLSRRTAENPLADRVAERPAPGRSGRGKSRYVYERKTISSVRRADILCAEGSGLGELGSEFSHWSATVLWQGRWFSGQNDPERGARVDLG